MTRTTELLKQWKMIYTYLTQEEFATATWVGDRQLNELFQELRKLDDKFLMLERKVKVFNWYGGVKAVHMYYTVYYETYRPQVHMINFPPLDDQTYHGSVNTLVRRRVVYAWMMGVLAHMDHETNQN